MQRDSYKCLLKINEMLYDRPFYCIWNSSAGSSENSFHSIFSFHEVFPSEYREFSNEPALFAGRIIYLFSCVRINVGWLDLDKNFPKVFVCQIRDVFILFPCFLTIWIISEMEFRTINYPSFREILLFDGGSFIKCVH